MYDSLTLWFFSSWIIVTEWMTRLLMWVFELSLTNCFRTQIFLLSFQNDSILFPPVDQLISFWRWISNFTSRFFSFNTTLSQRVSVKISGSSCIFCWKKSNPYKNLSCVHTTVQKGIHGIPIIWTFPEMHKKSGYELMFVIYIEFQC